MSDLWRVFEQKLAEDDTRFEDVSPNSDWRQILSDLGFSALKAGKLMKKMIEEKNAPPSDSSSSRGNDCPPSSNAAPPPSINTDDIARRLEQIEAMIRNMQGFPRPPSNVGSAQNQRTLPAVPASQGPPRDPVRPGQTQAFVPPNLPPGLARAVQQSSTPIALPTQMTNQDGSPGILRAIAQVDSDQKNPRVTFVIEPLPGLAADDDAHYDPANYGPMMMYVGDQSGDVFMQVPLVINPPSHVLPPQEYEFVDATTGRTISDVALDISNPAGPSVHVGVPANGQMSVSQMHLQPGFSRIQTQVAGYDPSVVKVLEFGGGTNTQNKIRVLLTPKIDSSKLQVTLGWADHPRDLDLHCVAVGNGVNRHVFFSHKNDTNIALDVDVVQGKGPETITITKEPNVTYYFSVHHFSGDSTIPESRAWLRVSGAGDQQTFHVPSVVISNTHKMFWLAFSVRNGVISQKNTFVAETPNPTW